MFTIVTVLLRAFGLLARCIHRNHKISNVVTFNKRFSVNSQTHILGYGIFGEGACF
jgi:hypothetical protein